jgi:small GTP-binding protein
MIHDVEVNLQIWDTAGQERFHSGSIGAQFFRGSHGALLVYDVNNEKSIEQIEMWRDECLSRKENDNFFPMVVVGNKIDLRESVPENQRVDQTHISQWCREQGYGHIETSAKDGHGVEAAMMAVVGLALEAQRNALRNPSHSVKDKIELKTLYEPKRSGMCGNCSK